MNRSISISCLLKFERKILVHSKTYEFAEFFSPENWIKLSQYIRFLKFLSRKFRNVVCFCGHPIFASLRFMWFCTVWFSCELELPIIYQYSLIKKTSVVKNIFYTKIVNILLLFLCQTYLFVLNSVFWQCYELTSRN